MSMAASTSTVARSLRATLTFGAVAAGISPLAVAQQGLQLFETAGDGARAHWLRLELAGYGDAAVRPLHEVLGVGPADRLVAHVAAYRTQRGTVLAPNAGGPFAHFFVEPLSELVAARDRMRNQPGASVALDFRPGDALASYPGRVEFPGDIFERITAGFLAALYLQIGSTFR